MLHCSPRFFRAKSARPSHHVLQLCRVVLFMLIAMGSGLIGVKVCQAATVGKAPNAEILLKCKTDLAQRFKVQARDITVLETQATTWPDAALGMPELDKMYAQVVTPGWKIILRAKNTPYLYTASAKVFKYGGPLPLWSNSMLYLMPVTDDANFNGDLYQCSLLGTNSVRLASEVTDFFPQEDGVVIIKRRTSRSSHELLFINAKEVDKPTMLHGAFDFGDAAMNSAQNTWAAFVRATLGSTWNIEMGHIGQVDAKTRTLPLPEGVQPGRIAWSGEKLFILEQKGERMRCFETLPAADKPEWKAVGANVFPALKSYMLNKSESLEITGVKEKEKPRVEVASVWFTGDRTVIATINGLSLGGYDLLTFPGYNVPDTRFVFIWGEMNGKQAAYTVDCATGEVIPAFHGACREIKAFNFALKSAPYKKDEG